MTKTDRRARRRAKAIESKRNQRVSEKPEDASIELTKEERRLMRAERVHEEIKEQRNPMRLDASAVTNYVGRREGGVIKGATLEQLYERLALEALNDSSEIGSWRAEVAVAYACCSKWLIRNEAAGATEWAYTIPEVEPSPNEASLPALAFAA